MKRLGPITLVVALGCAGAMLPGCKHPSRPHATSNSPNPAESAATPAPPDPRAADSPTIEVMTYNVNTRRHDRQSTLDLIREADADVVFLQETNAAWQQILTPALARRYPQMEFRHHGRYGGLAVLSRLPFATRDYIPSPIGRFPAWLVEVDAPWGPVQVMNLHLLPIKSGRENILLRYLGTQKVRARETREYMSRLDHRKPAVLVGDFNEDVRGQSLAMLLARGFKSAVERFAPDVPTWRWSTRIGEVRWQLDHILHSDHLETTWATIVDGGGSDHLPVIARLRPARHADN